MWNNLRHSFVLLAACLILGCFIYPALVFLAARAVAPEKANGSLFYKADGSVIGSKLIGQAFISPKYFWGRPSAVDFNGVAAGGRNHAPTGEVLKGELHGAYTKLISANPDAPLPVPADLLSASGSGLDPHISSYAAKWQVSRVAKARHIPAGALVALIERQGMKVPGLETVNVLELNLALDQMTETRKNL